MAFADGFDLPRSEIFAKTSYAAKNLCHAATRGFDDAYACSMSEYEHFRQSIVDPVTAPKK